MPKSNKTKKNRKKGTQAPPLLKLGNGTISTQKQQKKKKKKEGAQAPPMLRFRDGFHLHQNQQKIYIYKEGKLKLLVYRYFMMVPNYAQKQQKKKGEPNCAKTWRWHALASKNNKKKRKKKKKRGS